MARKLRVQYEGAIYHVTMRGVERRPIFKDDEDRERFLKRLGEAVEEFGLRLYLFSLLQNHIHLLVETPQANLSAFMHKLQTAYTVYYNLRHRRAGHLMQGRFGAEPVQGDTHLLKLTRYIHLNPVFVGRMRKEPLGGIGVNP
jgi:putative transposase